MELIGEVYNIFNISNKLNFTGGIDSGFGQGTDKANSNFGIGLIVQCVRRVRRFDDLCQPAQRIGKAAAIFAGGVSDGHLIAAVGRGHNRAIGRRDRQCAVQIVVGRRRPDAGGIDRPAQIRGEIWIGNSLDAAERVVFAVPDAPLRGGFLMPAAPGAANAIEIDSVCQPGRGVLFGLRADVKVARQIAIVVDRFAQAGGQRDLAQPDEGIDRRTTPDVIRIAHHLRVGVRGRNDSARFVIENARGVERRARAVNARGIGLRRNGFGRVRIGVAVDRIAEGVVVLRFRCLAASVSRETQVAELIVLRVRFEIRTGRVGLHGRAAQVQPASRGGDVAAKRRRGIGPARRRDAGVSQDRIGGFVVLELRFGNDRRAVFDACDSGQREQMTRAVGIARCLRNRCVVDQVSSFFGSQRRAERERIDVAGLRRRGIDRCVIVARAADLIQVVVVAGDGRSRERVAAGVEQYLHLFRSARVAHRGGELIL